MATFFMLKLISNMNYYSKALVLRGLDALTSSEVVIDALNKRSKNSLKVTNCHIARDTFTNVSSGFAFVEFASIQVT